MTESAQQQAERFVDLAVRGIQEGRLEDADVLLKQAGAIGAVLNYWLAYGLLLHRLGQVENSLLYLAQEMALFPENMLAPVQLQEALKAFLGCEYKLSLPSAAQQSGHNQEMAELLGAVEKDGEQKVLTFLLDHYAKLSADCGLTLANSDCAAMHKYRALFYCADNEQYAAAIFFAFNLIAAYPDLPGVRQVLVLSLLRSGIRLSAYPW
ncbi:MAG TPA: hypothetical protein PLP17_07480 [Oligoflexia bacterium]|nr:hypothetical protein [Oligoflexia bacterium]